ncbi:MAG: PAS domain S-box protein [Methanomicrobiaceae archaeon]|nr:PAS domain S-box protein [Methanomicrobiaceae archaeon]
MSDKERKYSQSEAKSGIKIDILPLIILSAVIVFIILGICYYLNYTIVTPHLIDIPIILFAFYYPKKGPVVAVLLSVVYILMVAVVTGFSDIEIIYAMGRAAIFVTIGTAVSLISARLNTEKKRYSSFFNSLSDTTYITTCTEDGEIGEIIECNDTTLINTGYSREELIGKPVSVLTTNIPPTLKDYHKDRRENCNPDSGIYVIETEHKKKDGTSCPVEMKIRSYSFDKKPVFIITARDISKRKNYENKLMLQAQFLESLIETIPIPFMYKDRNMRHIMCNNPLLVSLGMKKEDFIGKTAFEIYPPESAEEIHRMDLETMSSHMPVSKTIALPGSEGETRRILMNKMGVFSEDGEFNGVISVAQDITDLKKVKEDLRRSLEEKTILLQEVHHRVKNNLAIIIGFLTMQKILMDDEKCIEAITDAENRIYSLAAVHESIYLSENISEIDAQEHFENLVASILSAFSDDSGIMHSTDAGGCKLDIRQAIPASLIINEIITNSIKYAFKDRESGKISLKMFMDENHRYNMIISDDGIGIPADFDQSKSQTLGIRVINNIVRLQLKGDVTMKTGPSGTTWTISWK